jgi:cytochrome c-type biogenesis protein CcmH/NrfF
MAELGFLIWLIPLVVILIAIFILWIVTSIIRGKDYKEMTQEELETHNKKDKTRKKRVK